jgi:hypothetical protein
VLTDKGTLGDFTTRAGKSIDSNAFWGHVMDYLELGALTLAAVGILGFAFALAWIDASPRRRGSYNKSTD